MYENLVAWLRDNDFEPICPCCDENICEGKDCAVLQAADAIEELQKALGTVNDAHNEGYDVGYWAGRRDYEPKWISVTERLPGEGVHVLAACCIHYVGGGRKYYVCDAFRTGKKTKVAESYEYDLDLDYDEETDEYYWPEGWWEVIKNWDDYSCVAIADFVTHWMPLPEPPVGGSER